MDDLGAPEVHKRFNIPKPVGNLDQNGNIYEKVVKTPPKRAALFAYPKLPFMEMAFYWVCSCSIFLYAFYSIFTVSQTYPKSETYRKWVFSEPNDLGPLGMQKKDESDFEWDEWVPIFLKLIKFQMLHVVLFNVGGYLLESKLGEIWRFLMTLYWIGVACHVFQPITVGWSLVHALTMYSITRLYPRRLTVWFVGAFWLYVTFHYPFHFVANVDIFLVLVLMSYKLLSYISYCTEFVNGTVRQQDKDSFISGFLRMLYYSYYLPYTISLIVIHSDFEKQIAGREGGQRDWGRAIFHAMRMIFWFFFVELVLHYFYFGAILDDIKFLYSIPEDQLVSLGYATGMFFHLKYVVIFGGPALFAILDKMVPEEGPICINRVTLYAKTWRSFDRGLYKFFKEYIFIPIARPTFSIPRKIVGVLVSYSFVLLWHGFTHQYVVWILLNITEIFIEQIGKSIYCIASVRNFREKNLSDRNFRRLLGWLHIVPFAFALYSNFYFLAGSETGWVFAERIFWGETVTMNYPAIMLITIGYFYAQTCMEVDRLYHANQCPFTNKQNSANQKKMS